MAHTFSELRWLLGSVVRHPGNRHRRVRAIFRFVWWQLRKRLVKRPAVVRVGANAEFYTGLPFIVAV